MNEAILRVRRRRVRQVRRSHCCYRRAKEDSLSESYARMRTRKSQISQKRWSKSGRQRSNAQRRRMETRNRAQQARSIVLCTINPANVTYPVRKSSSASVTQAPPVNITKIDTTRTAKSDNVNISLTGDGTRDKCMELIYNALASDSNAREFCFVQWMSEIANRRIPPSGRPHRQTRVRHRSHRRIRPRGSDRSLQGQDPLPVCQPQRQEQPGTARERR